MTGQSQKLISIVVPLLNEESNIEKLYFKLIDVMGNLPFEVLFIDDGSTDGSLAKIEKLSISHPNIFYLSFSKNFGHQIALTAGLDNAKGDAVIAMDGDMQHPPEVIPEMLKLWNQGYDIVYTVRKETKGTGAAKKFSSDMFYKIFRFFTGVQIPSGAADFRLLDKKVVDAFRQIKERSRFLRGLTHWIGFKSIGIEYEAQERFSGVSKYNFIRMLRLAIDGVSSFSSRPLILSAFAGMLLAFAGGAYLIYVLCVHFFSPEKVVPGWTSILSVILFTSGTQLMFMGLIGVYLGKIFNEVKGRPLYFVKKTKLN